MRKIIEIGKEQIPAGLKLRTGIEDAIRWFDEKPEFDYLFDKIMKKYKSDNFTDVKVNFPIMVAGLLLGNGDFSKSICDAVNFGEDTDCTGATVGSILGIMNPDGIPEKWLAPIGRNMVLSPGIVGITPPPTIDAFSDMICEMSKHIILDPQPAKSFEPRPSTPVRSSARPAARKRRRKRSPSPAPSRSGRRRFRTSTSSSSTSGSRSTSRAATSSCSTRSRRSSSRSTAVSHSAARPGDMAPSFHRAPWNQEAFLEFSSAGEHTLRATIQRVAPGARPNWVVGVAYGDSLQWVPDAML